MNDATESSSHHGGKLEGGTHPLPFPSMLLLRKRPYEMDQQAKLAETEKLKKRGTMLTVLAMKLKHRDHYMPVTVEGRTVKVIVYIPKQRLIFTHPTSQDHQYWIELRTFFL